MSETTETALSCAECDVQFVPSEETLARVRGIRNDQELTSEEAAFSAAAFAGWTIFKDDEQHPTCPSCVQRLTAEAEQLLERPDWCDDVTFYWEDGAYRFRRTWADADGVPVAMVSQWFHADGTVFACNTELLPVEYLTAEDLRLLPNIMAEVRDIVERYDLRPVEG